MAQCCWLLVQEEGHPPLFLDIELWAYQERDRPHFIAWRSAIHQCRVYRSFDVDSDHLFVIAVLNVRLKRHRAQPVKSFLCVFRTTRSDVSLQMQYQDVFYTHVTLQVTQLRRTGTHTKILLLIQPRPSLADRKRAKKPWTTQETHSY